MFLNCSHRRSALAVAVMLSSAVLLAPVTDAKANITYNIVDYPASQTDLHGGTDTISGTIVTDGTIGYITGPNIVSASYTISNPIWGTSPPATMLNGEGDEWSLTATPDSLLLPLGEGIDTGGIACLPDWCYQMTAPLIIEPDGHQILLQWGFPMGSNLAKDPGSINQGDTWVIATAVPEPTSIALLGSALLGLGMFILRGVRQRRGK